MSVNRTYRCAIEGFEGAEEGALLAFFRMTVNLRLAFEHRPGTTPDIVIANADRPEIASRYASAPRVIFIGAKSSHPQHPCLTRPIRLTKVMQTLLQITAADAPAAAPAPPAAATAAAAATPRTAAAAPGFVETFPQPLPAPRVRVLVVDDSAIAQGAIRGKLVRYGFEIDFAASGEQALMEVRDGAYDLVFIDVMMDGLDGYQTCRMLKQRKYHDRRPPIAVMLTSRGGTVDKIRGSLAGCDGYLTKPVSEQELEKVLSKHQLIPPTQRAPLGLFPAKEMSA